MKMMKKIAAVFTLAFAAAAAAPTQAGDIYEIVPLGLQGTAQAGQPLYGNNWKGLTPETALQAGQSFEFIVRLVSRSAIAPTPTNSWEIAYAGHGSDIYAEAMFPLQLGLLVSGRLVGAEIYDVNSNAGAGGTKAFTDLYCRYTVKPGDLALPALLAHTDSGTKFTLINGDKWVLRDEYGNIAEFSYCDETTRTLAAAKRPVGQYADILQTHTLADLNYHIKTIDFDAKEDVADTWWRVVNQGATTTTNAPTVELTGAVVVTNAVELFAWAEDETAVRMVGAEGGTLETMTIRPSLTATADEPRNVFRFWTVPGKTTYPIAFEGVTEGKSTRLYLSTTTNFVTDAAGTYQTNFLTRTVFCTGPLPPSVKVTLDDNVSAGTAVTALSGNLEEMTQDKALALKVRLTSPLASGEAVLQLKVSLADDPSVDVFKENYLALAQSPTASYDVRAETNLVFTAGGATEQMVYVWPLGGDVKTTDGGILIEPVFDAARTPADVMTAYDTANGGFRLKIKDIPPEIVSPAADGTVSVAKATAFQFPVEVRDSYRDLHAPQTYKVELRGEITGSYFATNDVAFRLGSATTLTTGEDELFAKENATVTVTDAQGNIAERKFALVVPEEKWVKATFAEGATIPEGAQNLSLAYTLSTPSGRDLYAFLRPLNEAASNSVETAAYDTGIMIPQGAVSNADVRVFNFLDGAAGAGTELKFGIVLRTGESTNDTVVATYEERPLVVRIVNVAPTVKSATVDGRPIADGALRSAPVPMGVSVPLELELSDVAAADFAATNKGEILRVAWKQTDVEASVTDLQSEIDFGFPADNGWLQSEASVTTNAAGGLKLVLKDALFFSYEYTTQMVAVVVQDKDMRARGEWGPRYTFRVPVTDQPRVLITHTQSDGTVVDMAKETLTFPEENFRAGRSAKFTVGLSEKPTGASDAAPVRVALSVVRDGDGAIALDKTNLTFTVRNPSADVSFTLLDGGELSDFQIVAEVLNTTSNRAGIAWSDYYSKNTAYFTVANLDPVVQSLGGGVKPDAAATNNVPLGTPVDITVTASDIAADLVRAALDKDAKAFRVEWIGPGGVGGRTTNITYNTTSTGLTNSLTAAFVYTPQKEGFSEVEVNVYDGDGGFVTTKVLFFIEPTKRIRVLPIGPVNRVSSQSKYASQPGLGKGRVWAKASRYNIDAFAHTYYSEVREPQLTVYAFGYPAATNAAGYADDGTLADCYGETGKDYAISQSGSSLAESLAAGTYTYGVTGRSITDEWRYDNFFYCWFEAGSSGEEGEPGISEQMNGKMRPSTRANGGVSIDVKYDAYEADKESYGIKRVEAIFARELYPEDNMGDINADGIPDLYVLKYGLGVYDVESGEMAGNDLANLSVANEDNDALPSTDTSMYAAFIPGLRDSWLDSDGESAAGRKFTALTEIRGFHHGLNNAPQLAGIADVVCEVSTNSFSELELDAARIAGALLPDGNPDITKWSPERPTDPTLEDTDGDGLPDGYEYYIWYQAHVGYMENGVHKFMKGRKYVPTNPGEPEPISSEMIAATYDPLTPHPDFARKTSDIDNDGIPDYLEFEIGTNPFDFDTDGDGLPDGYELVMTVAGLSDSVEAAESGLVLDPLKYATDGVICDAELNADNDQDDLTLAATKRGDAMASEMLEMSLVCVSGENGGIEWYCAPKATPFKPVVSGVLTGAVFTATVGGEKGTYVTTVSLDPAQEWLARDLGKTVAWKAAKVETGYRLGEPVELPRGTAIGVVTNEAACETLTLTTVPEMFYRAWKYGIDNGFARGAERQHSVANPLKGRIVYSVREEKIQLIHFQVYQEFGFDPRTAWKRSLVAEDIIDSINTEKQRTRNYTHYDEFLSMAFFYYEETLTAEDLQPTGQRPLSVIWQRYSTNPMRADGDGDGMPDGWELYMMAGPKKYILPPDPKAGDRLIDYGPRKSLSPLWNFADVVDKKVRDGDDDGLEWPAEYSGIESAAEYAETTPTIVCLEPKWRNKKWPTDPWQEDTDGDGIVDGEEFSQPKVEWLTDSKTYNQSPFVYGESGTAGGGLNPLSWDTDKDGLPDPWEAEFYGTFNLFKKSTTNEVEKLLGSVAEQTWKAAGIVWNRDGMDGTVPDALEDYDGDGLANWQEYLVGAMRCWRYDDTISTWGNHSFDLEEAQKDWDNYWYKTLVDEQGEAYNPHLVDGKFDIGAYFSRGTNTWDAYCFNRYYMFRDGVYHQLKHPPAKYLGPFGEMYNAWTFKAASAQWDATSEIPFIFERNYFFATDRPPSTAVYPVKYICCHPMKADTDNDGMDDHYELFHGLNPLLGMSGIDEDHDNAPYDVIYNAYGGDDPALTEGTVYWSAENNYWLNANTIHRTGVRFKNDGALSTDDFFAFPWLAGRANADPDGDNIRNQQEAIMPNVQAASTYLHTDPTPLWMTDRSYDLSLTRRYYRAGKTALTDVIAGNGGTFTGPDGTVYRFTDFPGFAYEPMFDILMHGYELETNWDVAEWLWSFEENEGYDSDHDYLSDFEEGQAKMQSASDPQQAESPYRRQAMWFNGVDAFLQTALPVSELPCTSYLAAEPRQNFLYYTVECWAKADAAALANRALQTVVERAIWTGSSNAGDEQFLRKNFLIGLKEGRWYTRFDSTGTDAKEFVEIDAGVFATPEWTHLAATYDGTALKLYLNGVCIASKVTHLQPEHGANALKVNAAGELDRGLMMYDTLSILVGASARTKNGVVFDSAYRGGMPTTLADYGNFFTGYVDEIRIWDGARTAAQILADVENRTAYTAAMAAENKRLVYAQWVEGARRTPVSSIELPPELMYHWSFNHLPSAVNPADVIRTPAGFSTSEYMVDAKAVWSRPEGWTNAWWHSVGVRSSVYTDTAWVPWIADTVGHLPRFDGTTVGSVYWSTDFAGYNNATNYGYKSFSFARTGEVYSKWVQQSYKDYTLNIIGPGETTSYNIYLPMTRYDALFAAGDPQLIEAYRFTLRDRDREGFDLLPMGGAFPRRISADEGGMWDQPWASDAWTQTGTDTDNDGLPDWWEDYALQNYFQDNAPNTDEFTRDTVITYKGMSLSAWQAYQSDLAAGLILDGGEVRVEAGYESRVDTDSDGLPDYWEDLMKLNKLDPTDAGKDLDNDGLSVYQEYVLSEVYPRSESFRAFGLSVAGLDPFRPVSGQGQVVPDYFLCYTNLAQNVAANGKTFFSLNQYFGSIVTDHDFMEDWWERLYPKTYTSSQIYDPSDDREGDGWSTWAECRASLWGGYFSADLIDRWTGVVSDQYVPCRPEPVVGVRAVYRGSKNIEKATLILRVDSVQTPRVDATFLIPSELDGQEKFLGAFKGDTVLHGHLSPGSINLGSVVFERANGVSDKLYKWNYDAYLGQYQGLPEEGSFDDYIYWSTRFPKVKLESSDMVWGGFAYLRTASDEMSAEIVQAETVVGSIDARTGEFTLDMSKVSGMAVGECVLRVRYASRVGVNWPQTVYVSDTKAFAVQSDLVGEVRTGEGYIREGKNTIEAIFDLNNNGAFDPGEPYGFAQGVDVGWHRTGVTAIELFDQSPVVPRLNVATGVNDRPTVAGGQDDQASGAGADGKQDDASALLGQTKLVRVSRRSINGLTESKNGDMIRRVPQRTLLTKTFLLDDRAYLTEADVLSDKKFAFDSKWLVRDAAAFGIARADIAEVAYDVLEIQTLADGTVSNVLLSTFVNTFNLTRGMAKTTAPVDGAPVYKASPTFAFTSDDETMTAYRLQVRAKETAAMLYDSGVMLLPACVPQALGQAAYEVTEPIYIGDTVTAGLTNGVFFADGETYEWRVALYNAKFSDIEPAEEAWSAWAVFTADLQNEGRNPAIPSGYATVSAAVRYFGVSVTNDLTDKVVVEAFATADFRGRPLARVRVSDLTNVNSRDALDTIDAVLRGVEPGETFLRAYIDFNGNGKRDAWESWGYANNVGKNLNAIYNPLPVKLTAGPVDFTEGTKPDVVIYIEDCDLNKNEIPDGLEPGAFVDLKTDEDAEDAATWEEWGDVDLELDAELAMDGDVMAYREEPGLLVVLWDGTDENSVREHQYLYRGTDRPPVRGDRADGLKLAHTYDYNDRYGLGLDVSAADVKGLFVYEAKEVTVALVHAQVYDAVGFNRRTAVDCDDAVNTKPFTATDKKLLVRYLENTGRAPVNPDTQKYTSFEQYLMTAGDPSLWAKYTLRPDEFDADRDGIADGWELYVMAGPAGAASQQAGLSPWSFADRDEDPDGDGLANVREYDSGHLPTDPWNTDTHGDGLGDKAAYAYFFKYGDTSTDGEGYRADKDNDQLSNLIEYMISTSEGFDDLDAARMATFGETAGQLVPDYFLRHGSLYLGEMFADHDMMEDWWEDEQPVEVTVGGVRVPNVSRYRYDAHADPDDDGWSNWEELRASQAMGVTNVLVSVVTNETTGVVTSNYVEQALYDLNGRRPNPLVNLSVRYNGRRQNLGNGTEKYVIVVQAWSQENARDPHLLGKPDACWKKEVPNQHTLNDAAIAMGAGEYGYLRAGKNLFVAYIARDSGEEGSGAPPYTAGMPYGILPGVSVSYLGADDVSIEMTDVNASMMRIDLAAALARQALYPEQLAEQGGTMTEGDTAYDELDAKLKRECAVAIGSLTDRGQWSPYETSVGLFYDAVSVAKNIPEVLAASNGVTIRILRSLVNGRANASEPLLKRVFNLSEHPILTEADLTAGWAGDLDWGLSGAGSLNTVTSAIYRVVVGDGSDRNTDMNDHLAVCFENRFEYGPLQTPVANRDVSVNQGRPTFRWTHQNPLGKAYPSFRLRIWAADGSVVYDSGVQRAPVRDSNGVYSWTAPVCPGMLTADGVVFEAETDYTWGVSMLDAKFTKPLDDYREGRSSLRVSDSTVLSDYGQIAVAVKYMGPGAVSTTTLKNLIRVEAFVSSDFSGRPIAAAYVANTASLAAPDTIALNALLRGLPKDGSYYVRAFLDTDGDGERDVWESWGYGNSIGTDRRDVYTPRAYGLATSPEDDLKTPQCVIYLEDTDTNNNKLPDVWEWNVDGALAGDATGGVIANSPYIVSLDSSGAVATNLFFLIEKGSAELPYFAALTQMANGDSLASLSIALSMAGIDLTKLETKPEVTITSFSLTEGVTLAVEARATIDGETLTPIPAVTVKVQMTLTLQYATSLGDGWADAYTLPLTVDVAHGTQTVPLSDLAGLNEKILALRAEHPDAAFFRVKVELGNSEYLGK